jgi:hypothetical protein
MPDTRAFTELTRKERWTVWYTTWVAVVKSVFGMSTDKERRRMNAIFKWERGD